MGGPEGRTAGGRGPPRSAAAAGAGGGRAGGGAEAEAAETEVEGHPWTGREPHGGEPFWGISFPPGKLPGPMPNAERPVECRTQRNR